MVLGEVMKFPAGKAAAFLLFFCAIAACGNSVTAWSVPDTADRYHWRSEAWSHCLSFQSSCGDGIKKRNIWCVDIYNKFDILPDEHCNITEKPDQDRLCFTPCKNDTHSLSWKKDEWGPCLISEKPGLKVGEGLKQRNVRCLVETNKGSFAEVDHEHCYQSQVAGEIPDQVEVCYLSTKQDCVTSDWTEWGPCCNGTMLRTKSVLIPPRNGGGICPEATEYRICEQEDPKCPKAVEGIVIKAGAWGACTVPFDASGRDDERVALYEHKPRVKTQSRALECIKIDGGPIDETDCANAMKEITAERICIVPRDCEVSAWSDYVVTQDGCVDFGGNVHPTVMERRRFVSILNEGDGKVCPPLVDIRKQTENLPLCVTKLKWLLSKWTTCVEPFTKKPVHCGGGIQYRNITCVDRNSGQPVPQESCRVLEIPPTVQRCEMACPRDCEVSDWGLWGKCLPRGICHHANDGTEQLEPGIRKRSRSIIVPPSIYGMRCPTLDEIQQCIGLECNTWKAEPWGSCVPAVNLDGTSKNVECGIGHRTRKVVCVDENDEIIDYYRCNLLYRPVSKEDCNLPCPRDCVVSDWSKWSQCPINACDDIYNRYKIRTIIALPGPDGHACPMEGDMKKTEPCPLDECDTYNWLAMPWTRCNASCENTFKTREIWCVVNNELRVEDDYCLGLDKPMTHQACEPVNCELQCSVSEWSAWTECPKRQCSLLTSSASFIDMMRNLYTYRRRTRVLLSGHKYCTPLEEIEQCDFQEDCQGFSYRPGNWGSCQLAAGETCGTGLRVRSLECVISGTDNKIEMRNCYKLNVLLPKTVERCHVDCHNPCATTEWSSWSTCDDKFCGGSRQRTRQLIEHSKNRKVCELVALVDTEKCPCQNSTYESLDGTWSDCIPHNNSYCGPGVRYKNHVCLEDGKHPVDPELCRIKSSLEEESCHVPCHIDCQVSEWSAWGICDITCGWGMQTRSRHIKQTPKHGGRACPELVEKKTCGIPCDDFEWQTDLWSECKLTGNDPACGIGKKTRTVLCVHKKTQYYYNTKRVLKDEYCDPRSKPEIESDCSVICPGDCVLSEWSDWSSCSLSANGTCDSTYTQQRTRSLLRMNSDDGMKCPHAIEEKKCVLNDNCFTYAWAFTPYSSCLPLGGSPCGEGIITRHTYCQRSDGRVMDDRFCNKLIKTNREDKWCFVDCPIDCALDGYSPWDDKDCTCGASSYQKRSAYIKTKPSRKGRQCPLDVMRQARPCPYKACYAWVTSEWHPCHLGSAFCGHGEMSREVTCQRTLDKKNVDEINCLEHASNDRPKSHEKCFVPCDNQCLLSDWSEWSPCYGNCDSDNSYKTRSRKVIKGAAFGKESCNKPLWETADCVIEKCNASTWAYTQDRELYCKGPDGEKTNFSDCDANTRPSDDCRYSFGMCICSNNVSFNATSPEACLPVKYEKSSVVSVNEFATSTEKTPSDEYLLDPNKADEIEAERRRDNNYAKILENACVAFCILSGFVLLILNVAGWMKLEGAEERD